MTAPLQIGWFSTGRDQATCDLLTTAYESMRRGDINATIEFVFCSRDPGEGPGSDRFIQLVHSYRIPQVTYSYRKFRGQQPDQEADPTRLPPWRLEYDRHVMKRLDRFHPDLCVLAGLMHVVGPEMCRRNNMINLHPAAPGGPAGTWKEVIWKLIDTRARQTGVMMHLATPELDKGPPVAYCRFSIRGEPFDRYWQSVDSLPPASAEHQEARSALFNLIREHGVKRELPLIVATIKAFANGKVRITADRRVVDADGMASPGYDLTADIDAAVGGKTG